MSESATSDTPVLDLLGKMTADSIEASSLDAQTIALVRLAALVASDAADVSYAMNLAIAGDLGLTVDDVQGVLTAIAPIVGTSRVVAATSRIAEVLDVAIEMAVAEMAEEQETEGEQDTSEEEEDTSDEDDTATEEDTSDEDDTATDEDTSDEDDTEEEEDTSDEKDSSKG
jgi:alkylhydroperoxidase/carboxymuconolactone decarboxylase family protein YurZ